MCLTSIDLAGIAQEIAHARKIDSLPAENSRRRTQYISTRSSVREGRLDNLRSCMELETVCCAACNLKNSDHPFKEGMVVELVGRDDPNINFYLWVCCKECVEHIEDPKFIVVETTKPSMMMVDVFSKVQEELLLATGGQSSAIPIMEEKTSVFSEQACLVTDVDSCFQNHHITQTVIEYVDAFSLYLVSINPT